MISKIIYSILFRIKQEMVKQLRINQGSFVQKAFHVISIK